MTLIVAHTGLILADSSRDPGRELLRDTIGAVRQEQGKIFPFKIPTEVRGTVKGEMITDGIYGFSGTGLDDTIQAIGRAVEESGFLDIVTSAILAADRLRLMRYHDTSTVVFFGYKGMFDLRVESGAVELYYKAYDDLFCYSIGSGSPAFQRANEEFGNSICPVTAMYASFAMEPTIGGEIEVWSMPTSPKEKFVKLDTRPAISLPEVFKLVGSNPKPFYAKEQLKWIKSRSPNLLKTLKTSSKAKRAKKSPPLPESPKKRSKRSAADSTPPASVS